MKFESIRNMLLTQAMIYMNAKCQDERHYELGKMNGMIEILVHTGAIDFKQAQDLYVEIFNVLGVNTNQ